MKYGMIILSVIPVLTACFSRQDTVSKPQDTQNIATRWIHYKLDSNEMDGYIAWDSSVNNKRPGVLIVHEWWGLNDYIMMRTRELAKLGYTAMAIDMYGNGRRANDPKTASELSAPFYNQPEKAFRYFTAAENRLKQFSLTDSREMAAIGYCFGGGVVLNMAKMGSDMKGVVSFHGSLPGIPVDKNKLHSKLLILHGAEDKFNPAPAIEIFRKGLDSAGADYQFIVYPNATHAFTNPAATENGNKFNIPIAYNAHADTASFTAMKNFLNALFKH